VHLKFIDVPLKYTSAPKSFSCLTQLTKDHHQVLQKNCGAISSHSLHAKLPDPITTTCIEIANNEKKNPKNHQCYVIKAY
jgi:hypothetical protein